jgi:DNA-binding NtrC family response regulator
LTRALVNARGSTITADLLALGAAAPAGAQLSGENADDSLHGAERSHLAAVLTRVGGNKRRAARVLGVSRSRLDRLIEKHGLAAPERGQGSHES